MKINNNIWLALAIMFFVFGCISEVFRKKSNGFSKGLLISLLCIIGLSLSFHLYMEGREKKK